MASSSLADIVEAKLRSCPSVGRVERLKKSPSKKKREVQLFPNGSFVIVSVTGDRVRIGIRAQTDNPRSVAVNMKRDFERDNVPVWCAKM